MHFEEYRRADAGRLLAEVTSLGQVAHDADILGARPEFTSAQASSSTSLI